MPGYISQVYLHFMSFCRSVAQITLRERSQPSDLPVKLWTADDFLLTINVYTVPNSVCYVRLTLLPLFGCWDCPIVEFKNVLPSTMVGSISFHGSDCNGAVDQLEHNL